MASNSGGNSPNIGGPLILAALILGASVVGASLLLRSSIQAGADQIAEVVAEMPAAAPAAPQRQAQQQARPNRPDPDKRYEVVTKGSPAKGGPEGAEVEIVEFSDFQCPFCGRVTPTLKQIEDTYGDKVRIVFKHLPLSIHPKAPAAHVASEAAHQQGKFWEMHDLIFANQREMSPEKYREFAEQLGLDLDQYDQDVADPKTKAKVDADTREASKLLVRGTPGFFVNGRFLSGAQPFPAFQRMIDEELAEEQG